jgi:hypothetical protein
MAGHPDRRQACDGDPLAQAGLQVLLGVEAFPWDTVPRYLIRDRDGIYGQDFTRCANALEIEQILIAPRSPWQNPYVERVIGSVRRECLDHVVVFSENHLRRVLRSYLRYYNHASHYPFVLCA